MDTRISDKLTRFGRTLDIVAKVFATLCLIAAVMTIFGALIVLIVPDDFVTNILAVFPVTSEIFSLEDGSTIATVLPTAAVVGVKIAALLGLATGCVYCVLSAIILFILSALFKATAINKTPFVAENVKRLKVIGIILIIASILLGFANFIFAFCVLALAYVFQYGSELQQQADETL